jgi:hypothetical protein
MWYILLFFVLCLYIYATQSVERMEGFKPRCPNILIKNGNEILLKNTNLATIPGVNPVVFHNLQEYAEFVDWQRSQGIKCPLLQLEQGYNTQNETVYHVKPPPIHLTDASRDDPPYNQNSYPGMDPMGQNIGDTTMLDEYHEIGTTQDKSMNAMDPNWDNTLQV